MKTAQISISPSDDSAKACQALAAIEPQLVLVFAPPWFFDTPVPAQRMREALPTAALVGCSTAGEIAAGSVADGKCVVTAVRFDDCRLTTASTLLADMADSRPAGRRLAEKLNAPGLRAVMVFGQGININGSALIEGMTEVLGSAVPITGGLAGDGGAFARTWTLGPDGASDHAIVAVGLHGPRLQFSHGSFGGWEPFGPARKVTRSEGNVLFELDGEAALTIYKRYLGDYAKDLPASGLLFPFAMLGDDHREVGLIRTILGIDEQNGSLILAGEIVPGGYLKLMHASTDSLAEGAEAAARAVAAMRGESGAALAVLVSCVGRKLVMGDRVDDEVEAVASILGADTTLTGFYSYGEISPLSPGGQCRLHNQTMTISCIAETDA